MIAGLTQAQVAAYHSVSSAGTAPNSPELATVLFSLIFDNGNRLALGAAGALLYSCIPLVFHKSCQVSFLIVGYVICYSPLPCPHPFPDITFILNPSVAVVQFCWSTPPSTSECSKSCWSGIYMVYRVRKTTELCSAWKQTKIFISLLQSPAVILFLCFFFKALVLRSR